MPIEVHTSSLQSSDKMTAIGVFNFVETINRKRLYNFIFYILKNYFQCIVCISNYFSSIKSLQVTFGLISLLFELVSLEKQRKINIVKKIVDLTLRFVQNLKTKTILYYRTTILARISAVQQRLVVVHYSFASFNNKFRLLRVPLRLISIILFAGGRHTTVDFPLTFRFSAIHGASPFTPCRKSLIKTDYNNRATAAAVVLL